MLLALLLCTLQAPPTGPDSFGSISAALVGLEDTSAVARIQAERYLVGNLGPGDLAVVSDFVANLGGQDPVSTDALWRIGHAIGSGSGNLSLALDLFHGGPGAVGSPSLDLEPIAGANAVGQGSSDEQLAGIGDHAIDELISNWRTGLDAVPVTGAGLELLLREEREREPWSPIKISDGPIAEVVERLNRVGELPLPLVLAPSLSEILLTEAGLQDDYDWASPFRGPWDVVLRDFATSHGLAWEAVLSDGEFGDEIAWLRLVSFDSQGTETGLEQLRRSLEDYGRSRQSGEWKRIPLGERASRSSELQLSAHFLAGINWSEALIWLGDIWFGSSHKDRPTLSALLRAGGRGVLETRFLSGAGLSELLTLGDLIEGDPSLDEGLRGSLLGTFARLPRIGSEGPLAQIVLEDWSTMRGVLDMEAGALELRLTALEATGGGGLEGARRARKILSGAWGHKGEGGVQLAALLVLCATADSVESSDLVAASPGALLSQAGVAIAPDELGRLLSYARVRIPLAYLQTSGLSGVRPQGLRAALTAALLDGDTGLAVGILVDIARLDEQGSWSRVLEGQGIGRHFMQFTGALDGAVRRGDLLPVQALLAEARLRVGESNPGATSDGIDLGSALDETFFADPTALDRLELLSGAMPLDRQQILLDHLDQLGVGSPLYYDSIGIAQLAAGPAGSAARSLLLGRFEVALQSPKVGAAGSALEAIEHALALLWGRNADEDARTLVMGTAEAAAGVAGHPLSKRILYQSWPPSIARITRNLDLLDV
jgi:hypothetical protein